MTKSGFPCGFPADLPLVYPMRAVQSASVRFSDHAHGRRRITITHQPLAEVTPAMLLDWFTHLGETMTYCGQTVDRYHAWHPTDHIRWELWRPAPGGGAAEGARFHIVEAFGARPEFTVDVVDRVEKLDETGIRLVQRMAGVPVFVLEHTWSSGVEGTHYVSVMDIGARSALMAPVNAVLRRRFPPAMVEAWVRHNIEEVGRLEHLLPALVR
ncbi:hypothetical protein FK535_11110 [Mycolicibacterium sp. 018/SC-01/001]|uniref:hypothetical protein n=1 Tax=Mycolicibacterium sp. 018/SC-01/001 TaxID=2592069 RepID=UPI00117BF601|nr:hypothetical protein [Mycolicibacterium sp. 018/SC-01/001]TRW83208.1 hypothetical protein FK535_11110 [Mycolicibacterium sp. 018/SC-01/001]